MKKILIGAALAGVFAAVACTTGGNHPTASPPAQPPLSQTASTPEQTAANAVKPDFAGTRQIGAWSLVCRKRPANAAPPPPNGEQVQTSVIQKGGEHMLDIKMYIPPRPCTVTAVLEEADKPERRTIVTFDLRGPYGVLFLIFRTREELFPGKLASPIQPKKSEKENSGSKAATAAPAGNATTQAVNLDYDGKTLKGPLMVCGPNACIAGVKIAHEDEPGLLAAKAVAIELPAFPDKPPVRVNLPLQGLPEAIGALRRMEK